MIDANARHAVAPDLLRRHLDPAQLPFETTAEVAPLEGTIGQPRALDALEFGIEIRTAGYNLFVAGAPGSGRLTTVRDHLERAARDRPVPGDWVYVHNFTDPERPRALSLPAGRGRELAHDVDQAVAGIRDAVARVFDSDEYHHRRDEVLHEVEQREQALRRRLEAFAAERGFGLQSTPMGIAVFPQSQGKPLSSEEIGRLPEDERAALERRGEEIHDELQADLRRLKQLEREGAERVIELDRGVALSVVAPMLAALREKYGAEAAVLDHLRALEQDIPAHLNELRGATAAGPDAAEGQAAALLGLGDGPRENVTARYRVNVVVDNSALTAAPVVIERNPTYYNLSGRVEFRARFGGMVTDFTQIRAGALHRANGGFLVLDAMDVLVQPFAWEGLKRALRTSEVAIENLAEQLSYVPTTTLRPEPIPLDIKVVLIGSPLLHLLLHAQDDDMGELFKVKVDFAPDMEWNDEHVMRYAGFISRWVRRAGLRDFHRSAVARVVEEGARLREDQRKLSTRLLEISDLVTESSFWAGKAGHEVVMAEDVGRAIDKREYRSSLLEERVREMILDRTIMIETDGGRAGQVNGLSVVEMGDHSFGQPSRITASVSPGRGTVESVEREINLSGPIHSKGVLIVAGYLAATYGQHLPVAMRATITFEQSYDEVDGDSASSTELYALLSALADLPVRQGVAVTGSVNQHGEVQAVGGVTRKIVGFFEVCRARGLTGEQGVMIPAANVPSLMLPDDVVEAVRAGRFHVWSVTTIDEGLELLIGRPAGARQEDGTYPDGTVHRLVEDRLRGFAEKLREFNRGLA